MMYCEYRGLFQELDCPNKTEVLNSETLEVLQESENITEPCSNSLWTAPPAKTPEKDIELIVDLKCTTRLSSFTILNGFGLVGVQTYEILGSLYPEGPWTILHTGELPPGSEMTEEVHMLI